MEDYVLEKLSLINNSESIDLRNVLFKESINKCGKNIKIGKNIFFISGKNITIGKNVTIGNGVVFLDLCNIEIGDNSIIGDNVILYPGVFIPAKFVIRNNQIIKKEF